MRTQKQSLNFATMSSHSEPFKIYRGRFFWHFKYGRILFNCPQRFLIFTPFNTHSHKNVHSAHVKSATLHSKYFCTAEKKAQQNKLQNSMRTNPGLTAYCCSCLPPERRCVNLSHVYLIWHAQTLSTKGEKLGHNDKFCSGCFLSPGLIFHK